LYICFINGSDFIYHCFTTYRSFSFVFVL
jgi:hypothetical protein